MVKFVRTVILTAIALLSVVSVVSCSNASEPKILTAEAIDERINNIGEVSLKNEWLIEDIYVDYTNLPDSEKALVTNYEKLDDARNAIAKLYNAEEKAGPRFDRSKIQIGTYCLYNTDEEHIQWLSDAGIDFVAGAPYKTEVLDLFSKYDIGAFISYLPGWYGGDGGNSGRLAAQRPSGTYDSYAESFVDHPAIWAVDVGDEPSARDFPHFGVLIDEAKALFPNQLVYLNIYPIYANPAQQDCANYEEYIQIYADNVDTDYICFDFYDIDEKGQRKMTENYFLMRHVENLRIVADACREKGIDLWTVMQAGAFSKVKNDYLTIAQLNTQLYTSLAFGSKVINWACWESGWFNSNSNMINSDGERTPVYYNVQEVNANIKDLSPVYMKYTNTDAAFVGNTAHLEGKRYVSDADNLNFFETDGNVFEQDMFRNIQVSTKDSTVLAGSFVKNKGKGEAILFTNVSAFLGEDDVWNKKKIDSEEIISFTLREKSYRVVIYYPEKAYVMEPDENGVYSFSLKNAEGVFVTAEPRT